LAGEADPPLRIGALERFDAKRTARTTQCPALTGSMLGVIVVSWPKCALSRCLELHASRYCVGKTQRGRADPARSYGPLYGGFVMLLLYAADATAVRRSA
jgi:hypothetical protein